MYYRNLFTMILLLLLSNHILLLHLTYRLSIIAHSNYLYLLSSLPYLMLYLLSLVLMMYLYYSRLYLMFSSSLWLYLFHYRSLLYSFYYTPRSMLALYYMLGLHFTLLVLTYLPLYLFYIIMPSSHSLHMVSLDLLMLYFLLFYMDYSTVFDCYLLPYLLHNIH
jgi:hypothetical protein